MITIGIIFLVLFSFFSICRIGAIEGVKAQLELIVKRQDEIIKVLKNSK